MFVMKFEYPDITKSDVCVKATGTTLEEAFANIALGAFNAVTPIRKIRPKLRKSISLQSEDLKSLLYDWIEHLIVYFDSEMLVFSDFDIKIIKKAGKYTLSGEMRGEKIDPEKNEIHAHIKAVTYHLMEIKEMKKGFILQVILDL